MDGEVSSYGKKLSVLLLSRVEYEVSFSDILAFDHISPGECPDDTDLGDHRNREAATVTQPLSQEPCDLVKAPRPGGIRTLLGGRRIWKYLPTAWVWLHFWQLKESYLEMQRLRYELRDTGPPRWWMGFCCTAQKKRTPTWLAPSFATRPCHCHCRRGCGCHTRIHWF